MCAMPLIFEDFIMIMLALIFLISRRYPQSIPFGILLLYSQRFKKSNLVGLLMAVGSDEGGVVSAKMPFKRYVEIGRIALVNYRKDYGRVVVIVDVLDQNRALVDAPDMVRSQMNFKRLSLTDIKIDIP